MHSPQVWEGTRCCAGLCLRSSWAPLVGCILGGLEVDVSSRWVAALGERSVSGWSTP
jgi:hypothetical protein